MKSLRIVFLICSTLAFNHAAISSDLSVLAASTEDRSFSKMPRNASLDNLSMRYSLLYWADGGAWDPVNNRLYWVGGPGTCCADPAIYKLITYSDGENKWSIQSTPYSGSGHAYDGSAFDPVGQILYFGKFNDDKVKTWNGSGWSNLPSLPISASATPALVWFSDINNGNGALIYVGRSGGLAWYDGSSWEKIADGQSWGTINTFAEYSAAHKVVWMGAGNGAERSHYKLDTNLNMTKLKDAPFSLSISKALKSYDPVSGMYIVTNKENNSWWEYDIVSDRWNQISGIKNKPNLDGSVFHVPISTYGVILYLEHAGAERNVYIYRHKAGVVDVVPPAAPVLNAPS